MVTADQLLDEARTLEALALRTAVRGAGDFERIDTYRHAARTLRRHALELEDPEPPTRLLTAA